ncbi:MAG: YidC/Oxa1 family membrane protein insertase [Lachnospiraceae bacterium]|jgi:YidC/Oxa1 family membrane protein insertase|nr:YidC/Oxa1 family membrane protein insertase [Lachnospiraceae bacterium]
MSNILLTQYQGMFIGPIAKILGYLMEGIFYVLDMIGIHNSGLSIILFTVVIYLCMTPLTIKQQKFSKLQSKMSPEIQAIQAKYKNKKDNDSVMAMNQETQAVYAKYGVSASGSCIQLLIQMPILLSLYRVIYAIPAYVASVKEVFFPFVDKLIAQKGSAEFIQNFANAGMYAKQFENESFIGGVTSYIQNTYIDVLNRASTADWLSLKSQYPSLSTDIDTTMASLDQYNNFLGLNIANSPSFIIKDAFTNGAYLLVVGALLIPVLSAATQWINTKLMPTQGKSGNEQADQMAAQMKMMNTMMPLMSAVFCFTLPAGMGIYWIAGAVIRSIQQVVINKHIDKMDFDMIIEKNKDKAAKKMEKKKVQTEKMQQYANISTRNIDINKKSGISDAEREAALKKANEYYSKNAKPGSMAAKANMVREYNEKNTR